VSADTWDGPFFLALLLCSVGLWFLIEGAIYALAPETIQRFLDWAARLPLQDFRQGGFWTAVFGALLLYGGLRLI